MLVIKCDTNTFARNCSNYPNDKKITDDRKRERERVRAEGKKKEQKPNSHSHTRLSCSFGRIELNAIHRLQTSIDTNGFNPKYCTRMER